MKKKILFLVGSLKLGGIERLVRDSSIYLKETGKWDPAVCCLLSKEGEFLNDLERAEIPIFECQIAHHNLGSFPFRLNRIVREFNPEIVHSHVDFSMPWQVLGIRLGGGKKIIFTQHSDYQYWRTHFLSSIRIRLYFIFCWRFITAYTAVSKCVQRSVAKLSGHPDSDFFVIHNPVNTEQFMPDDKVRLRARSIMQIDDSEFLIGTVGRIAEPKGHSYLIDAAAIIMKSIPNIRFVIIGDGPLQEKIESQIRDAKLMNQFKLLGKRSDVQLLLPGLDVFVLPSIREGFPISLLEAMSCGIPVIASNVGGTSEAIKDDNGILVPPADPQVLAEKIQQLILDPKLAISLGKKARQYVVNNFNLDSIMQQYEELYEKINSNNFHKSGK
jgi:glycosyltransferase involved in cell wall biosynthesis